MFDKPGVAVFAKLDGRAFQNAARVGEHLAQGDMSLHVPGKAIDVIDDDRNASLRVKPQQGQHPVHGRAALELARHVIAEDLDDIIVLVGRIFSAAVFLGGKAIAFPHLFRTGDATVNHRFSC
ncbi:hypothetical protein JYP51_21205 [Ponticoccus gilvus]|nr:hypothetical protein [Enemella evansiae]